MQNLIENKARFQPIEFRRWEFCVNCGTEQDTVVTAIQNPNSNGQLITLCLKHFLQETRWFETDNPDWLWILRCVLQSLADNLIDIDDVKTIAKEFETQFWSKKYDFYICGCGYFIRLSDSPRSLLITHFEHLRECPLISK